MSILKNKYIHKNEYSRPGLKLHGVKKLILHWTANSGASADNHFTYFDKSIIDAKRYASAHIFVDKDEALCIVPLDEVAYQANDGSFRGVSELKPNANFLAIGVEMCVEKDGSFHKDTISQTEDVFVELCKQFKLVPLKDIVRHYDVTHKNCPAPWVKDGQEFEDFKKRVNDKLHPVKVAAVEQKAYRLVTGTFKTESDQDKAAKKLKDATGWVVYTVNSNGLRLQTGTFKTKNDVAKAQKIVKDKFGWLTYIK